MPLVQNIDGNWLGTHILFIEREERHPTRKTRVWTVENRYGDGELGVIKWFGRWRKYSFFPNWDCVFEEVCMRELSEFIETRTKEHRSKQSV